MTRSAKKPPDVVTLSQAGAREVAEHAATAIRAVLGPQTKVWWFGSWATGTPVDGHDLELAIDAGHAFSAAQRARLEAKVGASQKLYSIDLVDLAALSVEWRDAIVTDGVML